MNRANKREQQFLAVYDAYADAVFRHCYFRVYNRERAKELMQEAFTRAWEYMATGKEVKYVKALVYRVANNLIIDESRKKKEQSLEQLQEVGFEPSINTQAQLEECIDGKELIRSLALVEEEYRQVVYMRYVDDLKPKEIAHILGESVNVVSVRIHRGVAKLREVMKQGKHL